MWRTCEIGDQFFSYRKQFWYFVKGLNLLKMEMGQKKTILLGWIGMVILVVEIRGQFHGVPPPERKGLYGAPRADSGVSPPELKIPPPESKVPPANSKIPPADPKIPPAEPKIPPAEGKQPGFGNVIKFPENNLLPPPAIPKNPDGSEGILPPVPKNPDGTEVSPDEIVRRKLCGQDAPTDWRFDKQTGHCYNIQSAAACPENMQFYEINAVYGQCDCVRNSAIPLVFFPRNGMCYYIYQQAYCRPGEWLIFNRRGQPVCSPNTCLRSRLRRQSWSANIQPDIVPLNGNGPCVRLYSSDVCRPGEQVIFTPKRVVPTCSNPNGSLIGIKVISPVGALPCPAGSKPSILGNCNAEIDWDF